MKYLIFPGEVLSQYDGDVHFVTAPELMNLYKVDPKDCIVVRDAGQLRGLVVGDYIPLHPQFSGDYTLPNLNK